MIVKPGPSWEKGVKKVCDVFLTLFRSPLDLEQCSLQVLEPEGSPSWSLLKLLGDRGCTVVELAESLQALEHTEALRCLSCSGQLWAVLSLQPWILDWKHSRLHSTGTKNIFCAWILNWIFLIYVLKSCLWCKSGEIKRKKKWKFWKEQVFLIFLSYRLKTPALCSAGVRDIELKPAHKRA